MVFHVGAFFLTLDDLPGFLAIRRKMFGARSRKVEGTPAAEGRRASW
jgi:hypothetical protein